ncbi:MAG: FAD-dependent oxidoreductase [Patescibacteria group bacterium]|nr:FAD-dependent oxidoreductase [Patescibacteria group bacterium]
MYDLIIIGGGPAGVAAGIYAGRKKIKTLIITDSFGGQSIVSAGIENWIGEKNISGIDLAKKLEEHLRFFEEIEILENDLVLKVEKIDNGFKVFTKNQKIFETKYVLVASGSRRKKLNVPGEKEFEGKGVFYCSICDAPLLKNKVAAVIGGGNAGLEAVLDLLPYASNIYLLEFNDKLKGDEKTQEKIRLNSKVKIIFNAQTLEILGNQLVYGLKYRDRLNEQIKELKVDGIFVEIGAIPNSEMVKDLVHINNFGEILVDLQTQKTSYPGIWAAGDVTNRFYKQNNIAVGDAIVALLNINDELNKNK